MVKIILFVITVLLSISGICELIHKICVFAVSPKRPKNNFCVIFLDNINSYYQIRFAIEQYRWFGDNFAEKIIAVTDEVDENDIKKYREYAQQSGVIFCSSDVLSNVILSISE